VARHEITEILPTRSVAQIAGVLGLDAAELSPTSA
jgi:hypothetical protein